MSMSFLSIKTTTTTTTERKTKNKLMSMISSVQSRYRKGSPMSKEEKLRWEGFVEKAGFEPRVKERWMLRVAMMTKMD